MPAVGKVILDAKEYEATLARIQTRTAGAAANMSQNLRQFNGDIRKASGALNALGSAASKCCAQFGSAISAVAAGPVAMLAVALGMTAEYAIDLWDRATLSAEEYSRKAELAAENATKNWDKHRKEQSESSGYMDRLIELSRREKLSNAGKAEAARLIDILTSRYGRLGIQIDAVTGSITGVDEAQKKLLERIRKQQTEDQELRVATNRGRVLTLAKEAIGARVGDTTTTKMLTLGLSSKIAGAAYRHTGRFMDETTTSQQIEAFAKLRDKATTKEETDKFQKVVEALEKQLELERQLQNLRDHGNATESEEAARRRRETEAQQRKVDYMTEQTRNDRYQQRINRGYADEVEALKVVNSLKEKGIELSLKEAEAMVASRRALAGETRTHELETSLQSQLRREQALLANDRERAERLEIIADYAKRGATITWSQLQAVIRLKRELGSTHLKRELAGEGTTLYERALRAGGREKEADEYAALERARAAKGGELTPEETASTLRMVKMKRQLSALESPGATGSLQANELIQRGGGSVGRLATSAMEAYNRKMEQLSGETNTILRDIRVEIRANRQISYRDPAQ